MSRKRSRSNQTHLHGPILLPEQAPMYAQNPLGFPLKVPRGWIMHPIWRTRAARWLLVFCLAAPFVILGIAMLAVLIR